MFNMRFRGPLVKDDTVLVTGVTTCKCIYCKFRGFYCAMSSRRNQTKSCG